MKERIKSIDSIRGLAILAVILIHTTTRTLEASNFNLHNFTWTLFLNQITRFAVPLFIVISGFVLELNFREENYWSFIKKRFTKIFIPYVIWSLFYYFLIYNNNHDNFIRVILTGNASYQFYFIPTLCIFYIMFPLLHKLYKYISKPLVLLLLGVLQLYLLYWDYFVKQFHFPDPLHIAILSFFFFIIGMVAVRNVEVIKNFTKKTKIFLPILTAISGFYVFIEGMTRYYATGNFLSYYSQWRPSVFVYTILLGLTLYYLFEHTKVRGSLIARFSKHSFFAFFVHVAVLETVWRLLGNKLYGYLASSFVGKIIFDPLFFAVTAFSSFAIAYIFHKIPKSEKILG